MLPSFMIIGAQKSASTLLHQCLAAHPKIYMPPQEVPLFEDPEYGQLGIGSLHALFTRAPEGHLLGIKRPDYLAKPECPARIRQHVPHAKLLATVRDPIDRAISAYYHYMREGWISVRPLEEGMQMLLDGKHGSSHRRASEILQFGFYHRHLERYRQFFSSEQLLVMLHEDLIERRAESLGRVYEFLGVTSNEPPAPTVDSAKVGLYSLPRLRYHQATRSLTRRYNRERTRSEPIYGVVGRAVRAVDARLLAKVFADRKPMPSVGLVDRLRDLYEQDVARLEEDLGRDLSHWLKGR